MAKLNEKIHVWCIASIRSVLKARIQNSSKPTISQYYEADLKRLNETNEFLEIRIDGPTVTRLTKSQYRLYIEVNILVQSTLNIKDLYAHQKNVGIAQSILFEDIDVTSLGYLNDSVVDVGCFQLISPITVTEHGQIENYKVQQATVEAHYEMSITQTGEN